MEQVLPGADPDDPFADPITESNDLKDAGAYVEAYKILMELCEADLRCLDAHAHLGNFVFDYRPKEAIRHYEIGVRIGELSLGEGFEGVLLWGHIDNRPFLRCTIQESLRRLYMDATVPGDVRRRILEASVRAPQDWHQDAVRAAYSSNDEVWRLTAVFCMRFIRGFDEQILEALENENPDIHYEGVVAAGNWELNAAWPHVAALLNSAATEKSLLLAAIDAAASIRPHGALEILAALADSDDEDIVDAVYEAMAMAEGRSGEDEDDELNDGDDSLH